MVRGERTQRGKCFRLEILEADSENGSLPKKAYGGLLSPETCDRMGKWAGAEGEAGDT